MVNLMIYAGEADPRSPSLRTGGLPLVPDGFTWPKCRECAGAMRFLAHLPLEAGVVAVFMCQNDPGMCDDWNATAGANRAYLFDTEPLALTPASPPPDSETLLGAVTAISPRQLDTPDYGKAIGTFTATTGGSGQEILGQLGGVPLWIQNDETPHCPACATPMNFAAQLEEGYDHKTSANFGGGGAGYVFTCAPCHEAAFLWQC
ncbi:hypothetical protein ACFT9I_19720 [Streptomyces sp. NPDC057137]|uniref:hypothetical protein n=1 Tax=Streptomyces sp. NPDC057137 TaxID=3346030 RepID=UPI0036373A44